MRTVRGARLGAVAASGVGSGICQQRRRPCQAGANRARVFAVRIASARKPRSHLRRRQLPLEARGTDA
eukprot:3740801-Prymnesium_polylepis.1